MKVSIKLLILFLVISSCKEERLENKKLEFYYPNRSEFKEEKSFQLINLKTFENYNKLMDSVEILSYKLQRGYIKVQNDSTNYNVLVSTFFGQCYPTIAKFKNILSINNDSILKDRMYPIEDLEDVMKKDLENYGKDNKFSDSPEKLVVSVSSDIKELENLIFKICNTFNKIKENTSDSIILNMQLNRRLEILPPLPEMN